MTLLPLNYPLLPCFSKQAQQKVSSELRPLPTEERLNSYFEEQLLGRQRRRCHQILKLQTPTQSCLGGRKRGRSPLPRSSSDHCYHSQSLPNLTLQSHESFFPSFTALGKSLSSPALVFIRTYAPICKHIRGARTKIWSCRTPQLYAASLQYLRLDHKPRPQTSASRLASPLPTLPPSPHLPQF